MEIVSITLNTKSKRYKNFLINNKHLKISIFNAFDGNNFSKEEIVKDGLVTKDLSEHSLLTNGAIGCAASHRKIWRRSSIENKYFLVLEDDCFTHPQIVDFINSKFNILKKVDICLFGFNTDSILYSISPQGLETIKIFSPIHPHEDWIKKSLSLRDINTISFHELIQAFGTCAYFNHQKVLKNWKNLYFLCLLVL